MTGTLEAVAETIVDLGIDWSGLETVSDMQMGLRAAWAGLRKQIERNHARVKFFEGTDEPISDWLNGFAH